MNEILLNEIKNAYEARDLLALEQFAVPTYREINTKQNYRSVLMLSCHNLKHLSKIPTLDAECIMLNLEDGVSKKDKPFALVLCAIFLSYFKKCNKKLIVRVNALDDGGYEEIAYLNQFMPDGIRVPKIKTPKDVKSVSVLLKEGVELHLSIETASAWHNLQHLKIDTKIKAFYLGVLDLFADMGLSHSIIKTSNPTMQYILSHFLITCKAMGVKPVSFVYQDFENTQEFTKWIKLEESMGYKAKGCISPKQVKIVHDFFKNNEQEIEKAKEIIRLFEQNQAKGICGFVHEQYGFIDEPIYKGAIATLNNMI